VLRVELLAMAFLAAVPSFVISLGGITDPESIDLEVGALELVASVLAALGPAAIASYLLWRDGQLQRAFGRRGAGFIAGYGALGAVCCFIAVIAIAVVVNTIILSFGGELEEATDAEAVDLSAGVLVAILLIALAAGVGEEIVFRAYAISRMEEAGFGRAAIWVPWGVFTVIHLYQGPIALLVIGAVGAVLVWLYRWQRSVWPVMVAHALYDIGILLLSAAST
jgi:membrane protease YdiL (CAAX protease family)